MVCLKQYYQNCYVPFSRNSNAFSFQNSVTSLHFNEKVVGRESNVYEKGAAAVVLGQQPF